jgi:hypothetical protein
MKFLSLDIDLNGTNQTIEAPNGIPVGGHDTLQKILQGGIQLLFLIAIVLTLFYLIYGGMDWVMSRGEKQKIDSAKKKITYAIIGLVIVFLSFVIMRIVGGMLGADNLVGLPQ